MDRVIDINIRGVFVAKPCSGKEPGGFCDSRSNRVAEISRFDTAKRSNQTTIAAEISRDNLQTKFAQCLRTFIQRANESTYGQSTLNQDFRYRATCSSLSASSARDQNWLICLGDGVISHERSITAFY
jgi:hypothetical protein